MYQRILIFGRSGSWPRLAAAPEAKGERNDSAQHLIDDEEEQAREHDQHQNEPRRDEGFAPRRPDDLGGLGAHLLNKLEWVGHCLDVGLKFDAAGDDAQPEKLAARSLPAPRHPDLI